MPFNLSGEEYDAINQYPYNVTKKLLETYHDYLKFEENELMLEVGCGSGNVTFEVLLPYLPYSNFRLVCVDIRQTMLDCAKTKFCEDPRIFFRIVDITEKNEDTLKSSFLKHEVECGFDKVFSFSVINWTSDHKQSLKNIYTLMKPGGQAMLWFVGYYTINNIVQNLRIKEKYKFFLKDKPSCKFPFHDSKDTKADVMALLRSIGFTDIICECTIQKMSDIVDLSDPKFNYIRCVDPYMDKLPKYLQTDYLDDAYQLFKEEYTKTGFPNEVITIIANKPLTST